MIHKEGSLIQRISDRYHLIVLNCFICFVRKILFSRDNCFLPNIYLLSSPLQCAESGVKYLEAMLCVRSPLMMDAMTDVSAKNEDMMQLLKEGDRLNLFTVS